MTNKTIAILVIASACGKSGPEKATPDTEAFIASLNDSGLIRQVRDTVSRFKSAASGHTTGIEQCMLVRETGDLSNGLVKVLVEMPKKVPGLTKCRAQVRSTVEKLQDVLSHDIPEDATCDQVPPFWAKRFDEMRSGHCRFRAAIDACKVEAKAAGATTAFDEVDEICRGADAEGVTPSKYEAESAPGSSAPPGAPPSAPPAAPPAPPTP